MSQQNLASSDGDEPPTGPVGPVGPVHGWWQRLSSWQRVALPAGILTLVIAVIAAAALNSGSSSGSGGFPTAARDLQPFREAVDELAAAPGLQYKDTSTVGIAENTLTVTAAGSTYGTTSSGPSDNGRDVLRIGGRSSLGGRSTPPPRRIRRRARRRRPASGS